MAGKRGILPSVSELMGQSKKKKNVISSIRHACTVLRSVDVDQCDVSNLDLTDKASWAVAKHGLSTVIKTIKLMQSIPPTLVGHRKDIIASECNISTEEVISLVHLLNDHCDSDISHSDVSQVLIPPVQECFDCEHTLITNHVTRVKCYTCSGASFAKKITLQMLQYHIQLR